MNRTRKAFVYGLAVDWKTVTLIVSALVVLAKFVDPAWIAAGLPFVLKELYSARHYGKAAVSIGEQARRREQDFHAQLEAMLREQGKHVAGDEDKAGE